MRSESSTSARNSASASDARKIKTLAIVNEPPPKSDRGTCSEIVFGVGL